MSTAVLVLRLESVEGSPLHTGYSEIMGLLLRDLQASGNNKPKRSCQFESTKKGAGLRASLLGSSLKGVMRSATGFLAERYEARVCEHGTRKGLVDLPGGDWEDLARHLCPTCRVYGATRPYAEVACRYKGLPSTLSLPASVTSWTFRQGKGGQDLLKEVLQEPPSSAMYGPKAASPASCVQKYKFAWQKVSNAKNQQPLEIEEYLKEQVLVQVKMEPGAAAGDLFEKTEEGKGILSALCLSADLVTAGFFRLGRFGSRAFGAIRLTPVLYASGWPQEWASAASLVRQGQKIAEGDLPLRVIRVCGEATGGFAFYRKIMGTQEGPLKQFRAWVAKPEDVS